MSPSKTEQLLERGLELLAAGKSLLPVNQHKHPYAQALIATGFSRQEGQQEKASWKALQEKAPEQSQLEKWLSFPGCGLAIVTGRASGIIALDADGEEGIEKFELWNVRPHTQSRSGGYHWYIAHPGWTVATLQSKTNARLESIRGVDIRADGGYIIIPPTEIADRAYKQLRNLLELDQATQLPPEVQQLLDLNTPPVAKTAPSPPPMPLNFQAWTGDKTLEEELLSRALKSALSQRGRNTSGFELACQLRDNRFDFEQASRVMRQYAAQVPETNPRGEYAPYNVSEALHSLEEAYKSPAREPWNKKQERPATYRPAEENIFDTLRLHWPAASQDEREQYARCLIGSRAPNAALFLAEMNHDPAQAKAYIDSLKNQNIVIPGLNTLKKLLKTKRILS